jgi:hypothetical protein
MGDCTIGKELKQSTCRYVKKCKPGWVRNDKYICRKTLRRTGKRASNNSPIILTGNVAKNVLNSPNEKKKEEERIKRVKFERERQYFGNSSPNELPKLTNKEREKLFESPNDELPNELPKKLKKPIVGKVRHWPTHKNFRTFKNLQNSPNESFNLKKHKELAYARLRKTKDLKRLELVKQKEREGQKRLARKTLKKYNIEE